MDACGKKRLLMVMTSGCAGAAFGLLCIAVATDYWLFTSERIQDASYNTSAIYKRTYSGLWRKCERTDFTDQPVRCRYIEYFTGESDRDGLAPTDAILLSMKTSTIFPLASLLVLLVGGIICFVGHCNTRRNRLTFFGGILFVLAGLSSLIGIILYIGSITQEVGNKPKASVETPAFIYNYGSSFMMAVGSFALTELSGVLSVYLYISRHRHIQRKKQQKNLQNETNDRSHHWRHRRGACHTRDRSHSRERASRDPSLSRSESYFTYTPVSDTSYELSNYAFGRESSRNTISTTVETHMAKEHSCHSVDLLRRTTPV
ncbi:voltage-dependent calcium channel gamma-5 subunit-like [Octopus bimaculoides]|uniref:voltage-dependent calcium channel gamma-5 subunit-like n=1 Tax=Octopus bimaculoides TaxID=37653 RepID=UPI00220927D4|nr:voltage-dependent calcium channel gamma-5 subunit-like [Octopus bimaculoides]UVH70851.1 TARP-A [Octopus bimaculoides]